MLDIHFIRDHADLVRQAVKNKGVTVDIGELLGVDEQRRQLIERVDAYRAERNVVSTAVAKTKDKTERDQLIAKIRATKEQGKKLEDGLRRIEQQFTELMLQVPNIPWDGAPVGGAEANKEIKRVGQPPAFKFPAKNHIQLGTSLNLLDLEAGAKTSGFRGYYLKNEAVLMHYGLMWLGLQTMLKAGFELMVTPTIVKEFALIGSGHFPFGKDEIYRIANPGRLASGEEEKEPHFLAGTAEPSLLAYHAGTTFTAGQLPVKLCGISPCYRSEIGSYGKDLQGLYRIHEFMKVEQVVICQPDLNESEKWFDAMHQNAESLLHDLNLPYRLIETATGDMGAGKRRMIDIETWMPSRNGYGETHSDSNLTDWQTRRLNIKVRDAKGKTAYAYALNNTVIASPRILIAILENNQQKDGSVKVPKPLQKFVGKKVIKAKR